MSDRVLKLGIPAGSLQQSTAELFKKAGYNIEFSSRSYYPKIDDEQIDLASALAESDAEELVFCVEPGEHHVRIERRGQIRPGRQSKAGENGPNETYRRHDRARHGGVGDGRRRSGDSPVRL